MFPNDSYFLAGFSKIRVVVEVGLQKYLVGISPTGKSLLIWDNDGQLVKQSMFIKEDDCAQEPK